VVDFGAFVELLPGIEGLVHISELANRRIDHPHAVVRAGDEISVRILDVDPERRRIALSLRQADPDDD
jgi:small subunit ribosomal protein S1